MKALLLGVASLTIALAQPPQPPPGGFGGGGGRGPGGFGPQETKLLKDFDKDGDNRLNAEERKAARASLAERPRRGFGFGRGGGSQPAGTPGAKLTAADVRMYGKEPLYDLKVLRTLFLEFDNPEWEDELAAFHHTDVEVPATLKVDGKTYRDIGVHFRGNTSFMMSPKGTKRPLNLSLDFMHKDQNLYGYNTLNLLNAASDPTFLRTALYMEIARAYIPAPKVNYVRLVINGESWGVYVNAQQFNSVFTKEAGAGKGARWKVPGRPGANGGLSYLGDDVAAYKRVYEIKSKDDAKSWADLIHLCKVLNETPADQLEKTLEPLLDIDGVLRFLAVEKALINNDGYWTRASDYSIYQDAKGRFHVTPHDANETLRPMEGFGFGPGGGGRGPGGPPPPGFGPPPQGFGPPPQGFGPPGGGSGPRPERVDLDPFAGANDANKPLLQKLLAVPALRQRFIGYVRDIAETWLDWNKLGALAQQYQAVIADDIKRDTRKLDSTEAFTQGVTTDGESRGFGPAAGPGMSLKTFAEKRRTYLLNHPDLKPAAK